MEKLTRFLILFISVGTLCSCDDRNPLRGEGLGKIEGVYIGTATYQESEIRSFLNIDSSQTIVFQDTFEERFTVNLLSETTYGYTTTYEFRFVRSGPYPFKHDIGNEDFTYSIYSLPYEISYEGEQKFESRLSFLQDSTSNSRMIRGYMLEEELVGTEKVDAMGESYVSKKKRVYQLSADKQ